VNFLPLKLRKELINRDFCVDFGAKIHKSDRLLGYSLEHMPQCVLNVKCIINHTLKVLFVVQGRSLLEKISSMSPNGTYPQNCCFYRNPRPDTDALALSFLRGF
jgi:hypothetical protein